MLTHLQPQTPKNGKNGNSKKHCKTREFLGLFDGTRWSAAGAAAPLSFGEERTAVRQGHGQLRARRAPGRIKRLRATAGQGPNYAGPFCGYVGLCWPILRAMWAHLVAMLAYVGLMLIHVEPKDPKNGNSKKNTVKRRIF